MSLETSLFTADASDWEPAPRSRLSRQRRKRASGKSYEYRDAPAQSPEYRANLDDPIERRQLADLAEERGQNVLGHSATEHRQIASEQEFDRDRMIPAIRKSQLGYQYGGQRGDPPHDVDATDHGSRTRRWHNVATIGRFIDDPTLSDEDLLGHVARLMRQGKIEATFQPERSHPWLVHEFISLRDNPMARGSTGMDGDEWLRKQFRRRTEDLHVRPVEGAIGYDPAHEVMDAVRAAAYDAARGEHDYVETEDGRLLERVQKKIPVLGPRRLARFLNELRMRGKIQQSSLVGITYARLSDKEYAAEKVARGIKP